MHRSPPAPAFQAQAPASAQPLAPSLAGGTKLLSTGWVKKVL